MDIIYCLAHIFGLIGEIVHKGCQADFTVIKERKNEFYHKGKYSTGNFKPKEKNMPFIKFYFYMQT